MMHLLEQIGKEAQQALLTTKSTKVVRDGSKRKGHWQHYKGHDTWIPTMEISAHFVAKRS